MDLVLHSLKVFVCLGRTPVMRTQAPSQAVGKFCLPHPFHFSLREVLSLPVNSFLTSESTAPLSHMNVFLSKGGLCLKYRWACQHGLDDIFITCNILQQHVVNDPSPHPTRERWWAPASRLHSQHSFWACSAQRYYCRSWLLKIQILLHSSFCHDWY